MTTERPLCALPQSSRIATIDVFRGLTMFLMLFVNDIGDIDLGHIQNAPWWLKHMPGNINGMTLADVIFPCFLFIVGLTIPLALERRVARGDSVAKLSWHIVTRAMVLIFIGLCMVNSCHGVELDEVAMGISGAWWRLLMFSGVILLWAKYPVSQGLKKGVFITLRIVAALLLIWLLTIYRIPGPGSGAAIWLTSRWWGIIGLIGWAYLFSALIWLWCRNNGTALMGFLALLIALNISSRYGAMSGWINFVAAARGWVPSPSVAGNVSMVVAGMIVALGFRTDSTTKKPVNPIVWTLLCGAGFAVAGLLLWPCWGIHKNDTTPAWMLCSVAIACAVYALLYWVVEVKKITRWTVLIAPAGSNTLLMYMLPYVFYSVLSILGIDYLHTHLNESWLGVARSGVIAICFVGLTNALTRCHVRLKV